MFIISKLFFSSSPAQQQLSIPWYSWLWKLMRNCWKIFGSYDVCRASKYSLMGHTIGVIFADYPPINTNLTTSGLTNNTVVINTSFNLTCSAQAKPPAKYRFLREKQSLFSTAVGSSVSVYTTSVTERTRQVTYSCTPFNDYGDGPTQTITVTVFCKYPFFMLRCIYSYISLHLPL